MFGQLTERLQATVKRLRGEARLTEDNVAQALREVRVALLEADVALPVVKAFIEHIRTRALGQEVLQSITPGQAVVKIVHDELVALLGRDSAELNLAVRPPAAILIAGLQGSGKTTTVAKLARHLQENMGKSVLVASADVYRPAAIQQLQKLAADIGAGFFPSTPGQKPTAIAQAALNQGRTQLTDVVLLDTAGRMHLDQEMMQEIRDMHAVLAPIETLFIVDSMTGQDAINTAMAFDQALPLTGVILTKVDGDARGGAALSIKHVTGKPIKFLGVGEKTDALQVFHPDRLAARILGMGDVLTLVEQAQRQVDQQSAQRLAKKVAKGKGFDLEDFHEQLLQMEKIGGVAGLIDKLGLPAGAPADDKQTQRIVAMIKSMTPEERRFPDIIRGSRKRRIAAGSGTQVQDVNRLLKQFAQMQRMMKQMHKGGMAKFLQGMQGKLPG